MGINLSGKNQKLWQPLFFGLCLLGIITKAWPAAILFGIAFTWNCIVSLIIFLKGKPKKEVTHDSPA